MSVKSFTSVCVAVSIAFVASSAGAFEDFATVTNVCPTCEQQAADKLILADGRTLRCVVLAENTDFYVVRRYGENRAVPKSEVTRIEWQSGSKPLNLGASDQILLKNGHVLSGEIVEEKDAPPIFQIKPSGSDFTIMVAKDQVRKLYRKGSEVEVKIVERKVNAK